MPTTNICADVITNLHIDFEIPHRLTLRMNVIYIYAHMDLDLKVVFFSLSGRICFRKWNDFVHEIS